MDSNLNCSDISHIFETALQAHTTNDFILAQTLYEEVLTIEPEHAEANHNLGVLYVTQKEYLKALELFKIALGASPDVSLFWATYIDTLIKLDRITEAKTIAQAAKENGLFCERIQSLHQFLANDHQEPKSNDNDVLLIKGKYKQAKDINPKRLVALSNKTKKILYCVYDMEVSPCSYDFLTFLHSAEICRKQRLLDEIQLLIVHANSGYFRKDTIRTDEQNLVFFHNVIIPAISLLPSCNDFSWSRRDTLVWLNAITPSQVFPRGYKTSRPTTEYLGHALVAAKIRGDSPGHLQAPKYATDLAHKFKKNIGNSNYITVTTREILRDDASGSRKMDLQVWRNAFDRLLKLNIVPVIVRDTDGIFSKPLIEGIIELDTASLHLPFRAAIYENALLNFVKPNGPASIALYGKARTINFMEFDNNVKAMSKIWYEKHYGMVAESQFPMIGKNAKFVWEPETEELITELVEQALGTVPTITQLQSFGSSQNLIASVNTATAYLIRCITFNVLNEDRALFLALENTILSTGSEFDLLQHIKNDMSIPIDEKNSFLDLVT